MQTILLAIPRRHWLTRRAALGIAQYARQHTDWELLLLPADTQAGLPLPGDVGAAGAILSLDDESMRAFVGCGRPLVAIESGGAEFSCPRVLLDNRAVGRLAAEYFLARGYRHFAYVSSGKQPTEARMEGFRDHAERAHPGGLRVLPGGMQLWHRRYPDVLTATIEWLRQLPLPCALLACNDQHAVVVLQAARLAKLRVPEDLAVLGVHDEAIYRELGHVSLSSIAVAGESMGFEAAKLLHAMLRGEEVATEPVWIPPIEVMTRRSSDHLAVDDPDVREAVAWITEHLHERVSIRDLLRGAALSRKSIERKFREALGRTPHDELLRQRIARARSLLIDTSWSLKRVAQACGFSGREYFGFAFRTATGETPASFRKRFRSYVDPPERRARTTRRRVSGRRKPG